ncbi:MAG TPA: sugar transferase [Candidatus Limnocylindria bacterium]|nr:sugar transferase [Candidatus Limnocylindria bacterium]
MHRPYRLKRLLDIAIVLLTAPITVPLMIGCAIAVRLDSPGPILFSQERTGRNGRRFRMHKFRTMVENAEELKETVAHLNVLEPPDFKIIDDPRITRVGRILRRTSLDELPQLFNIVRGEMSIVGPRPTSFAPGTYDLWHAHRLEITPGLTGLWQVTSRNEASFDERVRLDIQYVRTASLWLDLQIIVRTVSAVLRGSGA